MATSQSSKMFSLSPLFLKETSTGLQFQGEGYFLTVPLFSPLASIVAVEESSEIPTATLLKIICLFFFWSLFLFYFFFLFKNMFFSLSLMFFGFSIMCPGMVFFLFMRFVCIEYLRVYLYIYTEREWEMSLWKVLSNYVSKYSCFSLLLSPLLLELQLNIYYSSQCTFHFSFIFYKKWEQALMEQSGQVYECFRGKSRCLLEQSREEACMADAHGVKGQV